MKLYRLSYDTEEGPHQRWFSSRRKAVSFRTFIRKNREDYGIQKIHGLGKKTIIPTLRGILNFLNVYCTGGESG